MTEQERMLAGRLYNAGDPELTAARDRAKRLCWRYNQTDPADYAGRTDLLRELLGQLGENSWIEQPFHCDYGAQISLEIRCLSIMTASFWMWLRSPSAAGC